MTMDPNKKKQWKIIALVTLCLAVALGGWLLYDNLVDRSGWILAEETYYYRDFHGRKVTGWQELETGRYCFAEDGAMLTQWQEVDGERYFFGDSGVMSTQWRDIQGSRYYFGPDGAMRTGWQDVEGSRYYFREEGALQTQWLEQEEGRYYLGLDGAMRTGWVALEEGTFYLQEDGTALTGEAQLGENRYLFREDGCMYTGWLEEEDGRSYYHESGILATGWSEIHGKWYCFDEEDHVRTGWYQEEEYRFYLGEDGAAAVGPTVIDGEQYYFTPKGIQVVLVNRNNMVPDDYDPDLVTYFKWHQVSSVCLEPMRQMIADCEAAGNKITFNSAYRSYTNQKDLLILRTEEIMEKYGVSWEDAQAEALTSVAYPGTSEHHLGLAVDLLGADAQVWLAEHCWEYGFILRYTAEKEDITGFIDEPWHFRYVGTRVSMDMKDSGLCLEEYLGAA